MPALVLLRHGQSQWNLENRFTGWWDSDLSDKGIEEARAAGRLLAMKVVMNRCPKIEYGRLSGEIGWAGVNSRTLSSARGKLGAKGYQNRLLGARK